MNNLDLKYLIYLMQIPDFVDMLLSKLSIKECIIVCAITKYKITKYTREKYYHNTYFEDGIKIKKYKEEIKESIYTMKELQNRISEWVAVLKNNNMTHEPFTLIWNKNNDLSNALVIQIQPALTDEESVIVIQKIWYNSLSVIFSDINKLVLCSKHTVNNRICNSMALESLMLLLDCLHCYTTYDLLSFSATLYTCRPTIVQHIVATTNASIVFNNTYDDRQIMSQSIFSFMTLNNLSLE